MMQYKDNYANLKGTNLTKESVLLYFSLNSKSYSLEKYAFHLICYICFLKEIYY